MGSSSSSQSIITDTLSIIQQNITNITSSNNQNTTTLCTIAQNQPITLGNLTNCTVNASQTANITNCTLDAIFNTSSTTDLSTIVNTAIQQAAASSSTSVQGFLATPLSSTSSSSNTNVSTYLQNLVTTNMTNTNTQTCILSSTITQGQAFTAGNCSGSTITIAQNAQMQALSSCLSTILGNLINNDSNITQAAVTAAANSSSTMQGLGDVIDSIAADIASIFSGWEMIIGIIIICVILGIGWLLWPHGDGSSVANTSANSSANIAQGSKYYY